MFCAQKYISVGGHVKCVCVCVCVCICVCVCVLILFAHTMLVSISCTLDLVCTQNVAILQIYSADIIFSEWILSEIISIVTTLRMLKKMQKCKTQDMTHWNVWHYVFVCVCEREKKWVTLRIGVFVCVKEKKMCDITYSCVRHDSLWHNVVTIEIIYLNIMCIF